MTRRIRSHLVIFSSIFCLGIVYTLFFISGKYMMFGLDTSSHELNGELTKGLSSLVLNAEEQRKNDVNTITGTTNDIEAKLRKSSDPVEFRVFQDNGDNLMYLYDRLLTSAAWKSNPRNLAEFREKLMNHTNSTFQEEFVLTQHNSRVGDQLPYAFTNTLSNNKTFFYKLSKTFIAEDVPSISPLSGKRFKRCSVVGNSGILSNSECGKEIDQSDYVIRSNLPPIRPHAVDAGLKTNLTTMNPSIAQRRFKSLKTKEATISFVNTLSDYYGVLWLPCVASTAMIGVCFKTKHTIDNHGVRNLEPSIANPFHYLAVIDFWKKRNMKKFLSTGFYMTHLALTMCEETHLYGFWPFPYRVSDTGTNTMRKVKYHYFDKIGSGSAHSMNDEFSVLLQMHVLGLLKLHVRDCGG